MNFMEWNYPQTVDFYNNRLHKKSSDAPMGNLYFAQMDDINLKSDPTPGALKQKNHITWFFCVDELHDSWNSWPNVHQQTPHPGPPDNNGGARQGRARQGAAGPGMAWRGGAGRGMAGPGLAGRGKARRGMAWQGSLFLRKK